MRRSPFGEIGIESELAELSRQPVVPSAAVAVSEPDEDVFAAAVGGAVEVDDVDLGADDDEGDDSADDV